ncbi:hypothetical protein BHM03_00012628 [Ensete ventricosum]|nr:hypothetical protein BHM03_00012628 [Ensete ventricosum]
MARAFVRVVWMVLTVVMIPLTKYLDEAKHITFHRQSNDDNHVRKKSSICQDECGVHRPVILPPSRAGGNRYSVKAA